MSFPPTIDTNQFQWIAVPYAFLQIRQDSNTGELLDFQVYILNNHGGQTFVSPRMGMDIENIVWNQFVNCMSIYLTDGTAKPLIPSSKFWKDAGPAYASRFHPRMFRKTTYNTRLTGSEVGGTFAENAHTFGEFMKYMREYIVPGPIYRISDDLNNWQRQRQTWTTNARESDVRILSTILGDAPRFVDNMGNRLAKRYLEAVKLMDPRRNQMETSSDAFGQPIRQVAVPIENSVARRLKIPTKKIGASRAELENLANSDKSKESAAAVNKEVDDLGMDMNIMWDEKEKMSTSREDFWKTLSVYIEHLIKLYTAQLVGIEVEIAKLMPEWGVEVEINTEKKVYNLIVRKAAVEAVLRYLNFVKGDVMRNAPERPARKPREGQKTRLEFLWASQQRNPEALASDDDDDSVFPIGVPMVVPTDEPLEDVALTLHQLPQQQQQQLPSEGAPPALSGPAIPALLPPPTAEDLKKKEALELELKKTTDLRKEMRGRVMTALNNVRNAEKSLNDLQSRIENNWKAAIAVVDKDPKEMKSVLEDSVLLSGLLEKQVESVIETTAFYNRLASNQDQIDAQYHELHKELGTLPDFDEDDYLTARVQRTASELYGESKDRLDRIRRGMPEYIAKREADLIAENAKAEAKAAVARANANRAAVNAAEHAASKEMRQNIALENEGARAANEVDEGVVLAQTEAKALYQEAKALERMAEASAALAAIRAAKLEAKGLGQPQPSQNPYTRPLTRENLDWIGINLSEPDAAPIPRAILPGPVAAAAAAAMAGAALGAAQAASTEAAAAANKITKKVLTREQYNMQRINKLLLGISEEITDAKENSGVLNWPLVKTFKQALTSLVTLDLPPVFRAIVTGVLKSYIRKIPDIAAWSWNRSMAPLFGFPELTVPQGVQNAADLATAIALGDSVHQVFGLPYAHLFDGSGDLSEQHLQNIQRSVAGVTNPAATQGGFKRGAQTGFSFAGQPVPPGGQVPRGSGGWVVPPPTNPHGRPGEPMGLGFGGQNVRVTQLPTPPNSREGSPRGPGGFGQDDIPREAPNQTSWWGRMFGSGNPQAGARPAASTNANGQWAKQLKQNADQVEYVVQGEEPNYESFSSDNPFIRDLEPGKASGIYPRLIRRCKIIPLKKSHGSAAGKYISRSDDYVMTWTTDKLVLGAAFNVMQPNILYMGYIGVNGPEALHPEAAEDMNFIYKGRDGDGHRQLWWKWKQQDESHYQQVYMLPLASYQDLMQSFGGQEWPVRLSDIPEYVPEFKNLIQIPAYISFQDLENAVNTARSDNARAMEMNTGRGRAFGSASGKINSRPIGRAGGKYLRAAGDMEPTEKLRILGRASKDTPIGISTLIPKMLGFNPTLGAMNALSYVTRRYGLRDPPLPSMARIQPTESAGPWGAAPASSGAPPAESGFNWDELRYAQRLDDQRKAAEATDREVEERAFRRRFANEQTDKDVKAEWPRERHRLAAFAAAKKAGWDNEEAWDERVAAERRRDLYAEMEDYRAQREAHPVEARRPMTMRPFESARPIEPMRPMTPLRPMSRPEPMSSSSTVDGKDWNQYFRRVGRKSDKALEKFIADQDAFQRRMMDLDQQEHNEMIEGLRNETGLAPAAVIEAQQRIRDHEAQMETRRAEYREWRKQIDRRPPSSTLTQDELQAIADSEDMAPPEDTSAHELAMQNHALKMQQMEQNSNLAREKHKLKLAREQEAFEEDQARDARVVQRQQRFDELMEERQRERDGERNRIVPGENVQDLDDPNSVAAKMARYMRLNNERQAAEGAKAQTDAPNEEPSTMRPLTRRLQRLPDMRTATYGDEVPLVETADDDYNNNLGDRMRLVGYGRRRLVRSFDENDVPEFGNLRPGTGKRIPVITDVFDDESTLRSKPIAVGAFIGDDVDHNYNVPGGRPLEAPGARYANSGLDANEPQTQSQWKEPLPPDARQPADLNPDVRWAAWHGNALTRGAAPRNIGLSNPSDTKPWLPNLRPLGRVIRPAVGGVNAINRANMADDLEDFSRFAGGGALAVGALPEAAAVWAAQNLATDIGFEAARKPIMNAVNDFVNTKTVQDITNALKVATSGAGTGAKAVANWVDNIPVIGKVLHKAGDDVGSAVHFVVHGLVKGAMAVNTGFDDAAKAIVKTAKDIPHLWKSVFGKGSVHIVMPDGMTKKQLMEMAEKMSEPIVATNAPPLIVMKDINGNVIFSGTQKQLDALRAKDKQEQHAWETYLQGQDKIAAEKAAAREAAAAKAAAAAAAAAAQAHAAAVSQGEAINRQAAIARFQQAGGLSQAAATQKYNDAIAKLGKASGKIKNKTKKRRPSGSKTKKPKTRKSKPSVQNKKANIGQSSVKRKTLKKKKK